MTLFLFKIPITCTGFLVSWSWSNITALNLVSSVQVYLCAHIFITLAL